MNSCELSCLMFIFVCSSYQLLYSSARSGSFFLFSSSLVEFSWCFSIFFLVQLTLLLLILMNLYLVNYLSFSLVSGLLSVFQWKSAYCLPIFLSSVQLLSHVQWFATPWLQHARPPCPLPTPRVYSDSCPLSLGWHPTIPSSVAPFSSCLQSFPASGCFHMSQFFASGGQSISFNFSLSPSNFSLPLWI